MNGFWTRGLRVALGALVALFLVWGAVAIDWAAFTGQKSDADPANAGDDVVLTDSMKKDLTVNPEDLLPGQAKCTSGDRFNQNSISGKGKWSDSVSTPFKSSDASGMLEEVFSEDCTNPTVLDMNIQALSRITIDGWNVGDHNPWMAQFKQKASEPGLRAAFLTKKENANGIYVTADFQRAAAMTNTLLLRFKNAGVVTEPSTTNWHLPGGGLVAGELIRTVLNDTQENLPVLRLELTEKGQGCVYAIGFNTGDKRFETLRCKTPNPKTPHTPTTGCVKNCTPDTGCTYNCNPPPCKSHCNPPPPCTHNCTPCKKDCTPPPHVCPPGQHGTWPICKDGPENQPPGNNPDGNQPGGHNDTDGPGIPNPEPTFPNTPYTPPPAPEPTKTPRPEPTQPPATGAPNPTEAPTTCVPAPGHSSC